MQIKRIYELLEQKRDTFERFLSATTSLRDIPDFEQNRGRIESLISERRRCIGAINRIDDRIDKIRKEYPSVGSRLPNEIMKLATVIGDIAARAEQVTMECEAMLIRWRDDTKNQMMRIRQGQNGVSIRADRAYRVRQPKFLDVTL